MIWFTPKCPVDDETREWIDNAFQWLIEAIGIDIVRSVEVILPTAQYFPDTFDGSRTSIQKMVERVCGYMEVDPDLVKIRFYENVDETSVHPLAADGQSKGHALGTYQKNRNGKHQISLETTQVNNPEMLVATIAHELGHVILLGEERLDPDYADHEPMTDLVTVFYGLGIFNANSAFVFEQWTNQQYQGWRAGGAGYLTEEMYGYALALFALIRNEAKPSWAKYLKTNVKSYFKSSVRYLNSSNHLFLNKKN